MTPKFEIIDIIVGESGKPSIKVVIIDDDRFIGYILTFSNIDFGFESNGIGVSYELIVDIHKNYLPDTVSEEQTKTIKEVAHIILEKIMTDFVEADYLRRA